MPTDNQTTTAAGKQEWTPEPFPTERIVGSKYGPKTYGIGPSGGQAFAMVRPAEGVPIEQMEADISVMLIRTNALRGIKDPAAFVAAVRAVVESVEVRLADGAESDEQVHTIDTTALSTLRAELTKLESTKPSGDA